MENFLKSEKAKNIEIKKLLRGIKDFDNTFK